MDGYWDLTHEKRGTYAAANTILILTILSRIMKLQFTSFVVDPVYWEDINIFLYIASIIFPLLIWVVGNWALTTLFDGKGKLGQVYMASCYCLLPYPLIQFPLIKGRDAVPHRTECSIPDLGSCMDRLRNGPDSRVLFW